MKTLIAFILYLWQLPQNIVGALLTSYYKGYMKAYPVPPIFGITGIGDIEVWSSPKMKGAISLGNYVILASGHTLDDTYHELGHCVQSQYLGWFYLPFLGLQSLAHAALHDCKAHGQNYEHFWTESWATKLGEKIRKFNNSK